MKKVPKAKCEKCKHCQFIKKYDFLYCEFLNAKGGISKPKRCSHFEKIGGNNNA